MVLQRHPVKSELLGHAQEHRRPDRLVRASHAASSEEEQARAAHADGLRPDDRQGGLHDRHHRDPRRERLNTTSPGPVIPIRWDHHAQKIPTGSEFFVLDKDCTTPYPLLYKEGER